jgi:hypothetical protein
MSREMVCKKGIQYCDVVESECVSTIESAIPLLGGSLHTAFISNKFVEIFFHSNFVQHLTH